jgi:hypothetical protein
VADPVRNFDVADADGLEQVLESSHWEESSLNVAEGRPLYHAGERISIEKRTNASKQKQPAGYENGD